MPKIKINTDENVTKFKINTWYKSNHGDRYYSIQNWSGNWPYYYGICSTTSPETAKGSTIEGYERWLTAARESLRGFIMFGPDYLPTPYTSKD